jgi:hypothetical protein
MSKILFLNLSVIACLKYCDPDRDSSHILDVSLLKLQGIKMRTGPGELLINLAQQRD